MPVDTVELIEGVNCIWQNTKLCAVEMKRAAILMNASPKSIGQRERSEALQMELEEYEHQSAQYKKVMEKIQELCGKIPER